MPSVAWSEFDDAVAAVLGRLFGHRHGPEDLAVLADAPVSTTTKWLRKESRPHGKALATLIVAVPDIHEAVRAALASRIAHTAQRREQWRTRFDAQVAANVVHRGVAGDGHDRAADPGDAGRADVAGGAVPVTWDGVDRRSSR